MKIVFATHNKNKFYEVQNSLPEGIQLMSLEEINCHEPIEETGTTLEANARIKADYLFEKYEFPCFADDTGLEVKALKGAPGVYSARYARENASDEENRIKLMKNMQEFSDTSAQFRTLIALRLNAEEILYFEGVCKGVILREERGENGFGYDAIFQPDGFEESFAEMDLNTKNTISHRGKAIKKLAAYFKQHPLYTCL